MKRALRVLSLSSRERRLLAEALRTLLAARARLRMAGTDRLRAWATPPPSAAIVPIDDILTAFHRAVLVLPGSTCLARALALQRLLSRSGHASELTIGVARKDNRLAAHAWLVHGGEILVGAGPEAGDKTVLTIWPSAGAPPPTGATPSKPPDGSTPS